MAGDTTEALQFAFQKLGELAQQYGPSAVDTAVQVERISAINSLTGIPGWGLVAAVAVWAMRRCVKQAKEADYDSELVYNLGSFIFCLVAIGGGIACLCALLNVWAWVGLFNPKLALAHDVLSALASKAGA